MVFDRLNSFRRSEAIRSVDALYRSEREGHSNFVATLVLGGLITIGALYATVSITSDYQKRNNEAEKIISRWNATKNIDDEFTRDMDKDRCILEASNFCKYVRFNPRDELDPMSRSLYNQVKSISTNKVVY